MLSFLLLFLFMFSAIAQEPKPLTLADVQKAIDDNLSYKWYEQIKMRGYVHFRYNRLLESNNDLKCPSCDRSLGDKQGFFFRRARLILYGDISSKIYVYLQPDYSSDANSGDPSSTQQNYLQMRDAYFDYHFDVDKELRLRAGLSKVIYGYENLQSSSLRGPMDRTDAINSGTPNERDMGLNLLWAPSEIRKRLKELSTPVLKGAGDYGVVGLAVYNGQGANRPEKNNDLYRAMRVTYPWKLKNDQFVEASLQAYEGKFNASDGRDTYEQRTGASFVLYPQPIGFQAEYNEGVGPEYDYTSDSITKQKLKGGYAQINYNLSRESYRLFPFVRFQEYDGGRKNEQNATSTRVTEWEFGSEWQPDQALELTASYVISDRWTQSSLTNKEHVKGNVLRLQMQFNY